MPAFCMIHHNIDEHQHDTRTYIRQQHFDRVDEGRVTQDTRIGMERPESHQLHAHHDQVLHAERHRLTLQVDVM